MQPLKDKEDMVWDAVEAAQDAMKRHASVNSYGGYDVAPSSIMGQFISLMSVAVEASTRATLKNLYTNDDFNNDLGLK